jgi:phosphate transport system permease protein
MHEKKSIQQWLRDGEPFIWLNAGAVSISVVAVIALLLLLIVKGFGHFWPADVLEAGYIIPGETPLLIIGEIVETERVPLGQLHDAGIIIESDQLYVNRSLIKQGNRDITGADFSWVIENFISNKRYPPELMTIERREWGNFYGYLVAIKESGVLISGSDGPRDQWQEFQQRIDRSLDIHANIKAIEKDTIGAINYRLDRLRLAARGVELDEASTDAEKTLELEDIAADRVELEVQYQSLQKNLNDLYNAIDRDSFTAKTMSGSEIEIPMASVVRAYQSNSMSVLEKSVVYIARLWEFLSDDPREANTEGGIFPAIFGTVMMVMLMAVMVTPFGVMAAVYLREYAKQGLMTRIVRIAVNNLAGVPSIVYGVFGLGFFIYFLGAEIDQLLFQEALPSPTFGTPGLLWASLTLALLTLPVVIVSTEEGLSRIPRSMRESSFALGATKAETLWRIVLPMASPAMITGLILAVARAAGEVAPLMLVGVVKLAPSLPMDGNYPYLHLDQKFMHLGFHIFDVGFQSPNVEAARPLVYATALLLVIIIALLNFSAVALRNRLREKYKALDM